ncbi:MULTISPECIES: glycosyltransferase family 4 protein [unclassified Rathayibacter]|uniref:glycosyltransferase family 4 protein n=1 Tax=unclassified Rathayibacter TaxID=2609250 RepID=UPI000F4C7599|nr:MULTISPECIES: glycosyltransferase family 4 protein [unclassified Rathayibacter]ROP49470.1 glycosyltransferase involved in cell wall biosynthesis [Rathayibacter sp. PhB186]ROS52036.1 glycosyltransferase involved in cell wall biosynthesis [Rathayibacter sp. PhB185]
MVMSSTRFPSAAQSTVAVVSDYALDYTGGAQTAMVAECRSLVEAGVRVLLIVPRSVTTLPLDGIDVRLIPAPRIPVAQLPVVRDSRRTRTLLERLLRDEGVGAVHVHSEFGLAVAALEVAAALSLPSVATVHTFFWRGVPGRAGRLLAPFAAAYVAAVTGRRPRPRRGGDDRLGELLRDVTRSAAARADLVISPSAHQASALRRAGLPRVAVLPNTVIPREPGLDDVAPDGSGPLRLLWVGRCAPEKRLVPFVEACLAVLARDPDALRVEIIGTGPSLAPAIRLAAGSPAVVFRGFVENRLIGDAVRRSDLVALTSSGFDNQPMVVVEALQGGRGVLYVDPALTEGLDGPGLLAPVEPTAFAEYLERLCRDRAPVHAAAAAARDAFTDFAPEAHAAAVLALYGAAREIAGLRAAQE